MRVLQAGMGGWGRNWAAEVIPLVGAVELVGCVDAMPPALELVQEEGLVPADDCYLSLEQAMEATDPDAVLVTANALGHVPLALAALQAGKHVLVEKPFATSLADAVEVVEMASAMDLTLMVSQNYRFFPAVRAVQKVIREGELGELHAVNIDFRRLSSRGTRGVLPHHSLDEPLLGDMSIHHFDLLRAVLGREPREIFCRTWNPASSPFSGPAEGTAVIVMDGGLSASYRASWLSSGPPTPWAGEWHMEFEGAELIWTSRHDRSDGVHGESVVVRTAGADQRPVALPKLDLVDRAGSLAEFASAVEEGREPESSGRENLGSLALMQAAIDSARTGTLCPVPAVATEMSGIPR